MSKAKMYSFILNSLKQQVNLIYYMQNTIKPLGKLLNQIRKTISRKSVNSDDETAPQPRDDRRKQFADLKYEFTTSAARVKSHIYADATELIIEKKTLFDYVLIVGLKERSKSQSNGDLDFYADKLNPVVLWKFPESVKENFQSEFLILRFYFKFLY